MGGAYTLTRLTTILATLVASPGAPAKFAKEGLLGEALLALAGMSAVEVGRTHLTGMRHSPGTETPCPSCTPPHTPVCALRRRNFSESIGWYHVIANS